VVYLGFCEGETARGHGAIGAVEGGA